MKLLANRKGLKARQFSTVATHLRDRLTRQHVRVVGASVSPSGGPGFEPCSGHLLDLFSIVPSSNLRPRL